MILLRKDRLPLLHSVKCECKVKISSPQSLTCRGSRAPRPGPGAAPPQPRAQRRRWPRWRGRGARYSAQSSPGQIVLCMLCTVFFTQTLLTVSCLPPQLVPEMTSLVRVLKPPPHCLLHPVSFTQSAHSQSAQGQVSAILWSSLVLQKVASELHPKVHNHGEGPY